jgi:dienelactone hydrolase
MPKLAPLRKIETLPGFVVNYLLCGPFNAEQELSSCDAFDKDYLCCGEEKTTPRNGDRETEKGPAWEAYAVKYDFIANLLYRYSDPGIVSYAVAYIYCPEAQTVRFGLGSDDGVKLFLNGKQIWCNHVHRGLGIDNDVFCADMKKGANVILLKIEHAFGAFEFCLRLTDPNGKVIRDLKAFLDHPDVKDPIDPAGARTFSGYDYLNHKIATTPQALSFSAKTSSEYSAWRRKFMAQYKKLLGPFPDPCPLNPEITEEKEIEGFYSRRLLIDLEPGFAVPCLVTVPKNTQASDKLPAVLCLHGHGPGKSEMLSLHADQQSGAIALHMARLGYVTISPDFLAFGERAGPGNPFGFAAPCPAEFSWAQTVGVITTTLNIHAVRRCVDYLELLNCVDKKRIAAVGHSFGGYMTTTASAVEKRIKVAVMSGYVTTIDNLYGQVEICGSQVVPGLFKYGDLSDIACTMAPRPVLIITGRYDCVSPLPFAQAAVKKIKKAYKLANAQNKVSQFIFDGEHTFQPQATIDFLDKWL